MADESEKVVAFGTEYAKKPVLVDKEALETVNQQVKDANGAMLNAGGKNYDETLHVASLFAKKAVRPDEIAGLRREMFDMVRKRLPHVEEVLDGTRKWNNVQARMFALLTERVIPKMSSVQVETAKGAELEEMSVEELEAIVMGKKKGEAIDAIEVRAGQAGESALESERKEMRATVKQTMAKTVAVDEATAEYALKMAGKSESESEKTAELKDKEEHRKALARERSSAAYYRKRAENPPKGVTKAEAMAHPGYRPMKDRLIGTHKNYRLFLIDKHGEETGERKYKEFCERRRLRKAKTSEGKMMREALGLQMTLHERKFADKMADRKREVFRGFRAAPARGTVSMDKHTERMLKQERRVARIRETEENPTLSTWRFLGYHFSVKNNLPRYMKLREARERFPQIFEMPQNEVIDLMRKSRYWSVRRRMFLEKLGSKARLLSEDDQ